MKVIIDRIDRIEEGFAVLLIQPDEEKEIYCPVKYLPTEAKEGSVLNITVNVEYEETEERLDQARSLIDKLKKKKKQ